MDLITSLTSQAINKAMDGLSMRHKAIASNLANVDTPNYKRREVSFEATLKHAIGEARQGGGAGGQMRQASNDSELAMNVTRKEHFPIGNAGGTIEDMQPNLFQEENTQFRRDGNGVDVETEMVKLARNTGKYNALANIEGRRLKSIKNAINSGN